MKILKEKSREYNGKPYFKFKVNLPEEKLKESDLKVGDELDVDASKHQIVLRKVVKEAKNA